MLECHNVYNTVLCCIVCVAFRSSPERDKKSFTASMVSKDRLTSLVHNASSSVH